MAVTTGDAVPDVELRTLTDSGPQPVRSAEVLGKGKVVLFAVPGAFTPGCSKIHLPGFVKGAADLKASGVDTIACVSVNDPWVMHAWGEAQGVGDDIVMLADADASFATAMGLETDLGAVGLGVRSQRYAAIIENGVITKLDVEPGPGVSVSSCESVAAAL